MRICNERPDKLDVPFSGEYTVVRVYESEKYGQLLKLIDANTGKEVQSLISPNRLKLSLHKPTLSNKSTDPPVVEVVANKYPVINFQQLRRNEEADAVNKANNSDQKSNDAVVQNKSESRVTTNSPATQQTKQLSQPQKTDSEPERKEDTATKQHKSTKPRVNKTRIVTSRTRGRSNWAQSRRR